MLLKIKGRVVFGGTRRVLTYKYVCNCEWDIYMRDAWGVCNMYYSYACIELCVCVYECVYILVECRCITFMHDVLISLDKVNTEKYSYRVVTLPHIRLHVLL